METIGGLGSSLDLDQAITKIKKCDYLKETEVRALCDRAMKVL